MHTARVPKTQREDKTTHTLFSGKRNPSLRLEHLRTKKEIIVVAVDPGITSYGFRVEKRTADPINPGYVNAVETLAMRRGGKFNKEIGPDMWCNLYVEISEFLNGYKHLFENADMLVIERQLHINYKTIRVQQHTMTYFTERYPDMIVVDLDARVKTKQLRAPKGMNKIQVKQWAVTECRQLLAKRNDHYGYQLLHSQGKKVDDMADTVVQIEAFCVLAGLPLTPDKVPDVIFDFGTDDDDILLVEPDSDDEVELEM